jgi:hypothetical protein
MKVKLTEAESKRCCVPQGGTHARRCEYIVKPIPLSIARDLVKQEHYTHSAANTAVTSHGLVRCDGEVVGAALWLPGPTPGAAKTVEPVEWRRVLHLSRVVVSPGEPTNAASLLVGRSVQLIRSKNHELRKQGKPTWKTLLTYADEGRRGHGGTIYKATNWEPLGKTVPERAWVTPDGQQVSRKATKTRTKAELEALGLTYLGTFHKQKFVMRLEKK